MKGVLKLIVLISCTMTICKGQSTRTSISPTDSLRRLLPKGYVVFTEDDEKFAILAEKQKIVCNNTKEFFNTVDKLTKKNNQE